MVKACISCLKLKIELFKRVLNHHITAFFIFIENALHIITYGAFNNSIDAQKLFKCSLKLVVLLYASKLVWA